MLQFEDVCCGWARCLFTKQAASLNLEKCHVLDIKSSVNYVSEDLYNFKRRTKSTKASRNRRREKIVRINRVMLQ
jgi:hypothetical protein